MTTAVPVNNVNNVENAKKTMTGGAHGKPQFSGRPNPLNMAYEKKVADLDARIAVAKARLDDLKMGGSGNANGANKGARGELAEAVKKLKDEMRGHQEERRRFLDQVQKLREDLKRKTGEVQEAKEKLPFRTIPEMQNRVREMESRIESGQLTLTEEKQTVAEISKLNKARKALENLDGNSSDVGSMKLRIEMLSAKVSEKDEVMKGIRAKLDELNAKFDALNGVKADEESKRKERQAAYEKAKKDLDLAYTQKREAYEEYRKAKQAAAEARIKRDARRAEYERRRQIEDEIEELEEKLLAFNPETTTDKKISECNNLKNFFMELIKEESNNSAECQEALNKVESGVRQVKLSNELAAAEVIVKDREEYFFAPKPKKGGKQQTATSNLTSSLSKLPLHILSGLADLRLPIPTNRSDIDQIFAELEKKKTDFSSKQDGAAAEKELQRKALQEQIDQLKMKLDEKPKKEEVAAPEN